MRLQLQLPVLNISTPIGVIRFRASASKCLHACRQVAKIHEAETADSQLMMSLAHQELRAPGRTVPGGHPSSRGARGVRSRVNLSFSLVTPSPRGARGAPLQSYL